MATTWALHVVIISNQICWSCLLNSSPYLLSSCSIPFPTQLSDVSSEDVFISQWKCYPGLQDSACLVLTCSRASFVFLALCMLAMWPKHLLTTGPLHTLYPQSRTALPLPLHLLNAFLFLYFSVGFPSGKCSLSSLSRFFPPLISHVGAWAFPIGICFLLDYKLQESRNYACFCTWYKLCSQ